MINCDMKWFAIMMIGVVSAGAISSSIIGHARFEAEKEAYKAFAADPERYERVFGEREDERTTEP